MAAHSGECGGTGAKLGSQSHEFVPPGLPSGDCRVNLAFFLNPAPLVAKILSAAKAVSLSQAQALIAALSLVATTIK